MTNDYATARQVAHVDYHGDLTAGPSAWSSERTDTGHYTIHHKIGTERYVVIAQVLIQPTSEAAIVAVTEEKPDYLCYRVFNVDGTDHDRDVQLVVFI